MAEETNNIETIELHRCPHCGKILTRGMADRLRQNGM